MDVMFGLNGMYVIDGLIYVIDLSMFDDDNFEVLNIIRFWLFECFQDRNYIPVDVEMTIHQYIPNYSMLMDIKRFSKITYGNTERNESILLFVNGEMEGSKEIKKWNLMK
eukprot:152002_1